MNFFFSFNFQDKDKPLFKVPESKKNDDSIYDGDYKPSRRESSNSIKASTDNNRKSNRNYFDKSSEQEEKEAGTSSTSNY